MTPLHHHHHQPLLSLCSEEGMYTCRMYTYIHAQLGCFSRPMCGVGREGKKITERRPTSRKEVDRQDDEKKRKGRIDRLNRYDNRYD